jgi:DNA-binding protein HU-beta
MNRKELVDALANKTGKSRKDANAYLDVFIDVVKDELRTGGSVNLVGFGSFVVKDRPAREARNPRTGEKIQIPPRKAPVFRPGKGLKEIF